jgi:hypothetical protein
MFTPDLKEKKQMIITVSPELIDLIDRVEALEHEDVPNSEFHWSYNADGRGATGVALVSWVYKEFSLYEEDGWVSANFREIGKHDYDDMGTLPFDSDYEADN